MPVRYVGEGGVQDATRARTWRAHFAVADSMECIIEAIERREANREKVWLQRLWAKRASKEAMAHIRSQVGMCLSGMLGAVERWAGRLMNDVVAAIAAIYSNSAPVQQQTCIYNP